MIVAISGSRTITDEAKVCEILDELLGSIPINVSASHPDLLGEVLDLVLVGDAKGVDTIAETWSRDRGIPFEVVRPDYRRYRRGGALRRSEQMIARADLLVAIWDGRSSGTKHIIEYARENECPVNVRVLQ